MQQPDKYTRVMIRDHNSTVVLIPDPEAGGYTARVPDIPAYRPVDFVDRYLTSHGIPLSQVRDWAFGG